MTTQIEYDEYGEPKETRQQCRHILTSGHRCQSPCLRAATEGQHEPFCYYHHTTRRPAPHRHLNRLQSTQTHTIDHSGGPIPFVLPNIEDASSIQLAINEIVLRITLGDLDNRRAGLLLYAMQIAAVALRATSTTQQPATRNSSRSRYIAPEPEIPTVSDVLDDPDLGLVAPITPYLAPDDRDTRPTSGRRLLNELDRIKARQLARRKAEEEAAAQAAQQQEVLPTIQATAAEEEIEEKDLSCRTGALRGQQPLRGASWASRSARSGARTTSVPTNGRRDAKRYTRHEVTARRAGAPSGRTGLYASTKTRPYRFST
jgi:DNA-binding protein H-NS